jgi:hypothetical protein
MASTFIESGAPSISPFNRVTSPCPLGQRKWVLGGFLFGFLGIIVPFSWGKKE